MVETRTGSNTSLAELLCALSFATDLGMGQAFEHGLKSAYIGLHLADALGASDEEREAVFYGALLKDAGCTACATVFSTFFAGDDLGPRTDCITMDPNSMREAIAWFWRHAPADASLPKRIAGLFNFMTECQGVMKESVVAHCEVGDMFARRLGLPLAVQQAVRFAWERWDGRGMAFGLAGDEIPVPARILHFAQAVQVAGEFGGRSAAQAIARERSGTDFDPALVSVFLTLARRPDFWPLLETAEAQSAILALRPPSTLDLLDAAHLDSACEVIADFADAKSFLRRDHSRNVAGTAGAIALVLGLSSDAQAHVRRAALVHDLGIAAVPVAVLDKGDELSEAEAERLRLHPYYTARILARVPPLASLADDAAAHHEWVDGRGYHRQLSADRLSLAARILAVADAYAWAVRDATVDAAELAVEVMRGSAGRFDPACVEALAVAVGQSLPVAPPRRHRSPGPLTAREIEVLQLVAEGAGKRAVAHALVISEKTVERHLENIFGKLDVSSRTAAVVWAMHSGLLE